MEGVTWKKSVPDFFDFFDFFQFVPFIVMAHVTNWNKYFVKFYHDHFEHN